MKKNVHQHDDGEVSKKRSVFMSDEVFKDAKKFVDKDCELHKWNSLSMHHHHYLKALATLGVLIMAQTFVRPQYLCAAKSIGDIDLEISKHEDYDANLYLLPAQQEQQQNSNVDTGEHYFVLHRHTNDDIPSVRRSPTRKNHILFNTNDDSQKILSRTDRSVDLVTLNNSLSGMKRVKNGSSGRGASVLERNERSTNLSHIAGSTRRIQLYIKNRFLQILADGTVNGTTDDTSDYSEYFAIQVVIQIERREKAISKANRKNERMNLWQGEKLVIAELKGSAELKQL